MISSTPIYNTVKANIISAVTAHDANANFVAEDNPDKIPRPSYKIMIPKFDVSMSANGYRRTVFHAELYYFAQDRSNPQGELITAYQLISPVLSAIAAKNTFSVEIGTADACIGIFFDFYADERIVDDDNTNSVSDTMLTLQL